MLSKLISDQMQFGCVIFEFILLATRDIASQVIWPLAGLNVIYSLPHYNENLNTMSLVRAFAQTQEFDSNK